MKTSGQLIAAAILFLQSQALIEADVIYQADFSGTFPPGWSRTTLNDENSFHQNWSVASSLETASGNQYARYDIDIPTLSGNPNTRWYGGYFAITGSTTALPAQWQLSFDIALNVAEPFQVAFQFAPGGRFPAASSTMTYWEHPANAGWQHVVIDQSSDYVPGLTFSSLLAGTYLRVSLASHDPGGTPLSISQVGTYDFLLDNVLLQSVPEPGAAGLCGLTVMLGIGLRRYRKGKAAKSVNPQ